MSNRPSAMSGRTTRTRCVRVLRSRLSMHILFKIKRYHVRTKEAGEVRMNFDDPYFSFLVCCCWLSTNIRVDSMFFYLFFVLALLDPTTPMMLFIHKIFQFLFLCSARVDLLIFASERWVGWKCRHIQKFFEVVISRKKSPSSLELRHMWYVLSWRWVRDDSQCWLKKKWKWKWKLCWNCKTFSSPWIASNVYLIFYHNLLFHNSNITVDWLHMVCIFISRDDDEDIDPDMSHVFEGKTHKLKALWLQKKSTFA